jgi:hypothetical protein
MVGIARAAFLPQADIQHTAIAESLGTLSRTSGLVTVLRGLARPARIYQADLLNETILQAFSALNWTPRDAAVLR